MAIIHERAPAKINLTLEILGKRADGYHELRSLVAFARDAADHITLDTSRPTGSSIEGPFAHSIAGQNLIDVTLAKLAAANPDLQLGHVTLTKNLPVAAGIGGGSADAAAVMRAVRRANATTTDAADWSAIALSIGADVPVCLLSRLALMTGIGEHVSPIAVPLAEELHAVIANPLAPVPPDKTAQVFRALRAPDYVRDDAREHAASLQITSTDQISAIGNDLEPAAKSILPIVGDVLNELAALPGARVIRMSGGGPTCFALFDTSAEAHVACAALRARRTSWWIAASALA
jgi:4-diphosphocytidyl-2-C-methyl-D-erythritol kinase